MRLLYYERQTLYHGIENKTKHIAFEDLKSCLKAVKGGKSLQNFFKKAEKSHHKF
jgi:hypothetical protein